MILGCFYHRYEEKTSTSWLAFWPWCFPDILNLGKHFVSCRFLVPHRSQSDKKRHPTSSAASFALGVKRFLWRKTNLAFLPVFLSLTIIPFVHLCNITHFWNRYEALILMFCFFGAMSARPRGTTNSIYTDCYKSTPKESDTAHRRKEIHNCAGCQKSVGWPEILKRRMETHNRERVFYCVQCKKSFGSAGHLN